MSQRLGKNQMRFVGLSTALANAKDVADWLGVEPIGLFNFKPSVRECQCTKDFATFLSAVRCCCTCNRPRAYECSYTRVSGETLLPAHGLDEQAGVRCAFTSAFFWFAPSDYCETVRLPP